jgi:hypothetical protein
LNYPEIGDTLAFDKINLSSRFLYVVFGGWDISAFGVLLSMYL